MATPDNADLEATLRRFLAAFAAGDVALLERSFAADATTFPRSTCRAAAAGTVAVDEFRRVLGMDPQMRRLIERRKADGKEPPLPPIEPEDLCIQRYGKVAVVSFHLSQTGLARRTLVFVHRDGTWQIVHMHASNVADAG